jgi:hypothetical protein
MKVENCIVRVERRNAGECVDLSFVFMREFFSPILRLWLVCAVPACFFVWGLTSLTTDMLLPSILIFLVFSSIFSSLLTVCLGPQVFAVPISLREAIRGWIRRFPAWLLAVVVAWLFQCLAGFCLVLPAVLVTAYVGHLPEVLFLEKTSLRNLHARLSWLSGHGGYRRNLGSAIELLGYWAALSSGIFVILDLLSGTLLNRPVFLGRIFADGASRGDVLVQLLLDDPLFLTGLQLAVWIPYPLIRVAWFFCYLDQRIRSECWDLQVTLRSEAHRLEKSS